MLFRTNLAPDKDFAQTGLCERSTSASSTAPNLPVVEFFMRTLILFMPAITRKSNALDYLLFAHIIAEKIPNITSAK